MTRFAIEFVESLAVLASEQETAAAVERHLNDEKHRGHGFEGIYSTGGRTIIVWRVAA
jgi:hypothetical protein